MDGSNPREYGLGSSGTPIGKPVAEPLDDAGLIRAMGGQVECPNCRCEQLMQISLQMMNSQLRGGVGLCRYVGCPACPWASPAVITAMPPQQEARS
jgi:hypothetical protein